MAKLKTLKGAPKSFEITVELDNLDGSKDEIIFTCKGRTLREWQPIYLNRLAGEANAKIEAQEKLEQQKAEADEANTKGKKKDDAPAFKRVEFNEQEVSDTLEASFGSAVQSITDVSTGWNLEDEFNGENLKELISRFPGTQAKLFQQYHERILGNRAKN